MQPFSEICTETEENYKGGEVQLFQTVIELNSHQTKPLGEQGTEFASSC